MRHRAFARKDYLHPRKDLPLKASKRRPLTDVGYSSCWDETDPRARMAEKQKLSDLLRSRFDRIVGPEPTLQPASPEAHRNRRKKQRKHAFKEAVLISEAGARIPVIVRNFSDTGARVDFVKGGAGDIRARCVVRGEPKSQ